MGLFSLDLELSAGGGVALVPYQEGLDVTASGYKDGHIRNRWADWGLYAFFDAHYVEAEIGFYKAFWGNYEQYDFGDPFDLTSDYEDIDVSYLDLGIALKYPIKFNTYVITPMIGFNYWMNMRADYGYESARDAGRDIIKKDWDQMWAKVGVSLDRYLTKRLYARLTAKLDLPIQTNDWKDRGNNIEDVFGMAIDGVNSTYFGVGGDFALSLGYRIK
jgi:hypothetical protein